MHNYLIKFFDGAGRFARAEELRCKDDLEALAEAERAASSQAVEIWEGRRIVARVKRNNAPLTSEDPQCL